MKSRKTKALLLTGLLLMSHLSGDATWYFASGAVAPTYLIDTGADFSGTGWTGAGADLAPDWTDTSPSPPVGSQSLRLFANGANATETSPTFAATTDVHFFFRLYITSYALGTGTTLFVVRSSTTARETFALGALGAITIVGGSATTGTMSTGTWYYIWGGYNAGTGASYFTFSDTSTKPTSGANYTTASQAGTVDIDNVRLQSSFTTLAGTDLNIVHVLVDDAAIGNNP